MRVPAHVHDARTRLRRARSAAPAGAPAAAALAAAGLGAAQAAAVEAAFWRVASLDAPAPGSSRETRLGDGVSGAPEGDAPGGAGPSGASEAEAAARSALATALATLLPRERAVLRALFGLDAPPGAPLPTGKQVAARLGLSAPTVTRAKESALAKLRHPERAAQLRHLVATLAGGP